MSNQPEPDPNRPPLPVGAAAPGRIRGSAFADGREPGEIRWADRPVAVGPGERATDAAEDGEGGPDAGGE